MGRVFARAEGGRGEDQEWRNALFLFAMIVLSLSVVSVIVFSCGIGDSDERPRRSRKSGRRGMDGGRVGGDGGGGGGCRGGGDGGGCGGGGGGL